MKLERRRQLYPHEEKLGVHLVEEYLGEHCGRVARELSSTGRLTFTALVDVLGKTPSLQDLLSRKELYSVAAQPEAGGRPALLAHEVGKAVAVMSHHGLIVTVRAQPHNRGRTRSRHQVLQLDLRNILLRFRIPQYTLTVQEFFFPNSVSGSQFGSQHHDDGSDVPPSDPPVTLAHFWLRTLVRTVAVTGQTTTRRLFEIVLSSKEQDHEGPEEGDEEEGDEEEGGEEEGDEEDRSSMLLWFELLCAHHIIVPVKGVECKEERHVPNKSVGGVASSSSSSLVAPEHLAWGDAYGGDALVGGGAGKRKRGSAGVVRRRVNPEDDTIFVSFFFEI
jgi:hypothetical protein